MDKSLEEYIEESLKHLLPVRKAPYTTEETKPEKWLLIAGNMVKLFYKSEETATVWIFNEDTAIAFVTGYRWAFR